MKQFKDPGSSPKIAIVTKVKFATILGSICIFARLGQTALAHQLRYVVVANNGSLD